MMTHVANKFFLQDGRSSSAVVNSGRNFFFNGRMAPMASYTYSSLVSVRPHQSVQEIMIFLRDGGLPISCIAEIMRVERKTVYSWLEGGGERGMNKHRATSIYSLLRKFDDVGLKQLYRFWNFPINGQTMHDLLTAQKIDDSNFNSIFSEMYALTLRAKQTEKKMLRKGVHNPVLDEIPEVGISA